SKLKDIHDKAINVVRKDETKAAMEEAYNEAVGEVNRIYDEATSQNNAATSQQETPEVTSDIANSIDETSQSTSETSQKTAQVKSAQNKDVASEATNEEAQTKKAAVDGGQENAGEASNTESNGTDKGGVVVTGDEFGEYKDIKELRAKAKKYYKENLQGTSVDNPILGQVNLEDVSVQFTRAGLGKMGTTSAKEHKLLLVAHLPELIRSATSITREDNVKNKRDASQYSYLHTEATIDGKRQPVTITIFTDVNGNKYYNHILPNEEQAEKTKDSPVPPAQATNNSNGIPAIGKSYVDSTITQTEPTSKDKNETKQDTKQQKRSQNEDAFSNGKTVEETTTQAQPGEGRIFGNVEDADREMLEALGITEENLEDEEELSFTDEFGDTTDEEIEALKAELKKELSKVSSNPIFNPKIYSLGLQLGGKYIQKGYRTFKKWLAKMQGDLGDGITPWAGAIWETLKTYPKGERLDPKKVMAISKAIGARYEDGKTSKEEIQEDLKKVFKGQYKTFAPMIEASYNGIKVFFDEKKGATDNELNDRTDIMVKRNGQRDNQNSVGGSIQDERARDDGGRSLQEDREENEPQHSARVRTDSPALSGEISYSGIQEEEPEDSADSAGSVELSGSARDSYDGTTGLDDGRKGKDIGTSENRRNDATPKVKENNVQYKAGDLESIQADLPSLLPEQMEDVVKAEKRLLLDHGRGMMFTNGTGTGKTFTGLGVVKRFALAGKQNIIIVAPNDDILNEWVRSGKKYFDLDIHKLENTRTAGSGIIATTYANFGQNDTLAKREWDLVVTDESHKLMSSEKADDTAALNTMRALTHHTQGIERRLEMLFPKLRNRVYELLNKARTLLAGERLSEQEEKELEALQKKLDAERKKIREETNALKDEDKPKVLFLSATPFAYVKAVDYANGYLFDYGKADNSAYNSGDGYDRFFMEHFGYRMRYNKLTKPDASVNQDLMEREFNSWLKKTGALSGRTLKLDTDYDRGFLLVDGGIGAKIDAGMKIFEEDSREDNPKYKVLGSVG
ncbi:MAG: DEAD/DEAH box helicase family protein, partial [Selenomonadaceae bacterium]|nr:DEAD/DEAH box helicase family protein [Selenomonadaceae bacterium]